MSSKWPDAHGAEKSRAAQRSVQSADQTYVGSHATESMAVISDSVLQLNFKKLSFAEFWCLTKECPRLSEKAILKYVCLF